MTDAPNPAAKGRGGEIRINALTKVFRTPPRDTLALSNIDHTIRPGRFCVLLGRSGCGKTTLLRMLGGLLTPTEGTIQVDGATLYDSAGKPRADALGHLGFVFQEANLLPWRSVRANIELPMEVLKTPKEQRRARAQELAQLVGLEPFLDYLPARLSGGMRQRVSIARALTVEPSTLLMDEPFGALDALTRDSMNLLVQDLWMRLGTTVVLVTHSISEAILLADEIVVLSPHPGRIQRVVEVPFARPRRPELARDPAFHTMADALRAEIGEV